MATTTWECILLYLVSNIILSFLIAISSMFQTNQAYLKHYIQRTINVRHTKLSKHHISTMSLNMTTITKKENNNRHIIHYLILMFTAWLPNHILFIKHSTNKLTNVCVVLKCVNVIPELSLSFLILLARVFDFSLWN